MDKLGFSSGNTNKKNHDPQQKLPIGNLPSFYKKNPDPVFIVNQKGEVISVNKRFTELFGFTTAEIRQYFKDKEFFRIKEKNKPYFQKALQGMTVTYETVFVHKKGWYIPAKLTLIPEKRDDQVIYILGHCSDLRDEKRYEKRIETLLEYLEQAEENTNIGTWDYDFKVHKTFFSTQTYRIFGIQDKRDFVITLDSLASFFLPADFEKWKHKIFAALEHKEGFELSHQTIRSDGELRDILQRAHVLLDEEGKVSHLVGTIQDVTEIKEVEKELDERTTQFISIADRLHAGIWSINMVQKKVIFCSKGVEEIYGISVEEFIRNPLIGQNSIHPEDRKMVEENLEKIKQGQERALHYRIIDKSGKIKWLSDQTVPVTDREGNIIRLDGIITDITDEKNHAEEQVFMANHDFLTKLPNRRYFEQKLGELLEGCKKEGDTLAMFYFDLDRFKYINDTLGHEMGDRFLQAVSERLKMSLGGEKEFLARMGGDEFTICMKEESGREHTLKKAAQLLAIIEKPFFINGYELYTSASLGLSFFPEDGDDVNTLVRNADRALYQAKESGKNDWQLYSSSMNFETYKNSHLEKDLRKAINNNQFFLEYQPKVGTLTGKIEGAEALLRWRHPERGIVSPGEFIPLAEEAGLISKLGDWVLKEVCELQKRLLQKGVGIIPVCVNVSPKSLLKADFIAKVKKSIQDAGIDPKLIELELTESIIIENTERTKDIISELKDFGVMFALDDFGTGYSSLTYLKDLDIDTLKIDRSFIKGIGVNKANEAIIKAVIFLAKEMGIRVIAEGVEEMEQLEFLKEQNCPRIQGFIFSRPVSEKKLEEMLAKGVLEPR